MLWCSPEDAPPPGYFTVYWAQYISERERKAGNISLPEMINEDASYWKPRYLSWLEAVGNSACGSTTVVDALLIRPGLSYWWMTVPGENPFSTTSIAYATLRLWGLTQIVEANQVEELRVVGADAEIEEILTLWCNRTGRRITIIAKEFTNKNESENKNIRSRIEKRLPALVNGFLLLALQYRYYFTAHRPQLPSETGREPSVTMVDFLTNLDVEAAQEATYISNYWGPLTQILSQAETTVNWIHIEVTSAALPDVRLARAAIRGLNRGSSGSRHVLLQDYLTLRVAFKASAQYVRLRRITKQVAAQISWVDIESGLDVAPLIRSRLHSDFKGMGAARNALWLSLFGEVSPAQTPQGSCIYLMENQPWELALLQSRMTHGGPNVGVAHVPVRTWDFRYALGSSAGRAENGRTLPKPSHFAVIDPKSETVMIANGLEPSAIVKIEALRFLSRSSITAGAPGNRTDRFSSQRVLVFGEYDALMCGKQIQLLEEITALGKDSIDVTFRAHPGSVILQRSLPKRVSHSEALTAGEDLAECDVVLCSNVSYASLDASLRGIPILMLRDGRGFNGSSLIPGQSVTYVDDAADVIGALEEIESGAGPRSVNQIYPMFLDSGLTKWRALLDWLANIENK
jgi:surface carbohydrate biosynthesis protein (TIGR04326 family)